MTFKDAVDVHVRGERWAAVTDAPVKKGQTILVTDIDGLTLKIQPVDE